jgi:hypothetical protein
MLLAFLLGLLGCASRATMTSLLGQSSSCLVLQKITEAGPTPDMGRTYMMMADDPHVAESNGYPHGH